ncbi:hypothetical protein AHMF7605_16980 [Adhaeribacter arboris]|uniref:Uncharacterized protein n=1 Tax=Adhaeribacter arboris TaxID=2072846 RepID=A0A2T2YHU1_9BACT|nr:hypothetical protein AHMF7605_16980 [Adhaeribacter arboris]
MTGTSRTRAPNNAARNTGARSVIPDAFLLLHIRLFSAEPSCCKTEQKLYQNRTILRVKIKKNSCIYLKYRQLLTWHFY